MMKARDIAEDLYDAGHATLVAELPNGQKVPIKRYRYDNDAKGNPVIVLVTGNPPKK